MPEPYLTTTQVADIFHVSTETIVNMCKRGELRHIKVAEGRRYRIPLSAVDEFAAEQGEKASA